MICIILISSYVVSVYYTQRGVLAPPETPQYLYSAGRFEDHLSLYNSLDLYNPEGSKIGINVNLSETGANADGYIAKYDKDGNVYIGGTYRDTLTLYYSDGNHFFILFQVRVD